MSCLDDRTILDLLQGGLDDAARRRVEDELARCARCAAVVGALVRDGVNARSDVDTTLVDLRGEPELLALPRRTEGGGDGRAEGRTDGEIDHDDVLCDVLTRGLNIAGAIDRELNRRVAHQRRDASDAGIVTRAARKDDATAKLRHPGFDAHAHLARRIMRHHRSALVVATLCAIAIGTVTGVSIRRFQDAREGAEAEPRNAVRAGTADVVRQLLHDLHEGLVDGALAVQHLASARTMHEERVVRDPDNRDPRRSTAVTHAGLARALLELGRAHAAQGRPREARAAWRRGADLLRGSERPMPLEAGWVDLLADLDGELRRARSAESHVRGARAGRAR